MFKVHAHAAAASPLAHCRRCRARTRSCATPGDGGSAQTPRLVMFAIAMREKLGPRWISGGGFRHPGTSCRAIGLATWHARAAPAPERRSGPAQDRPPNVSLAPGVNVRRPCRARTTPRVIRSAMTASSTFVSARTRNLGTEARTESRSTTARCRLPSRRLRKSPAEVSRLGNTRGA
jgi:hypothetical protein